MVRLFLIVRALSMSCCFFNAFITLVVLFVTVIMAYLTQQCAFVFIYSEEQLVVHHGIHSFIHFEHSFIKQWNFAPFVLCLVPCHLHGSGESENPSL